MSMVGNLRKVASLARRSRRRVDLSHPARSPLGSTVVNCVVYRDGVRQPPTDSVEEAVRNVRRHRGASCGWACTNPARRSSPESGSSSACTRSQSRTPSTPTSAPRSSSTATSCSPSSRPSPTSNKEIQAYFRDVADHLTRVTEQITAFDVLLDSILQAHLAQVTVAQNKDMRKITAWAAIIAVPTMVCGVYGMNFDHMPELRWRFGYLLVLAVIATASFVIHRGFKRNGWL